MTMTVEIKNADNSTSPHGLKITRGADTLAELKPGESKEVTVWQGGEVTLTEFPLEVTVSTTEAA